MKGLKVISNIVICGKLIFLLFGGIAVGQQLDTVSIHRAVIIDTLLMKAGTSKFSLLDDLKPTYKNKIKFRKIENRAFFVGERFVFEIAYGFIKAGIATMSIPDTRWVQGRLCYHIVTTAESNKFFSFFFKVRDRVESLIDMDGIFTWRFEKHIREGKFSADRYVEYDQYHRNVITKKDTMPVPLYVQDILSSFYYVRTLPMKVGDSFNIDNYADGKIYPLKVLVHRKERIKVPAGSFNCIVVEPVLRGAGLFNQKGKLTIWLTDDERRIPVLMKSKVVIGSIDARLKSFKLGERTN